MICTLEALLRQIPAFLVFVFIFSFVIFLMLHGFAMSNLLMNHDNALWGDGLGGIYGSGGGGLSSGRFLLALANSVSSDYTMPWVIVLISALWFSLTICVLAVHFQLRHKLSAALMAFMVAGFPTAACTFSFMYTADGYFLALLLSVLSVFIAERFRRGFIPAALLNAAVLGIYQAYFCVSAALAVFTLLFLLLREDIRPRDMILQSARHFIALAAGLVVYRLALNTLLSVTGTELSSYLGIDHMWFFPIYELGERLSMALRSPILYFRQASYPGYLKYIHYSVLACSLTALSIYVYEGGIYRSPLRLAAIIILVPLADLGCGLIFLMSGQGHMVMVYAVAMQFVAFAVALDRLKLGSPVLLFRKAKAAISTIMLAGLVLLGIHNALVTNKAYLKQTVVYETSYAFCLRLTDRIQSVEGYKVGTPVMFVGELSDENRPKQYEYMEELVSLTGVDNEQFMLHPRAIPALCSYFIGESLPFPEAETKAALIEDERVAEMAIWPYASSVQLIDGVVVVKLGNENT